MTILPLIEAKRDGQPLAPEALASLVRAYVAGDIPDYQMAAFLMAVHCRGLDAAETRALTLAMRDSGEVLHFAADSRPVVDKHSTGGVGDKVSLPLAPLLACLGFRVPMICGRSLGITGGTLDKLESIPGLTTALSRDRILQQVQDIGCVICGQTGHMVPADRKLYALRDATGTVPAPSLITASILAKKLAARSDALVLDVKFGSGAFMRSLDEARDLAQTMVGLAHDCGLPARALLTDMNTPLGRAAGNWLEVKEAVQCLDGQGPPDLQTLVVECAAHLYLMTERTHTLERARVVVEKCLQSGAPRRRWNEMLAAQGADLDAFAAKLDADRAAPVVAEITAGREGYVTRCDARILGDVVRDLGAGRLRLDAPLNPDVGVSALAKPGDHVTPDSTLVRVHAAQPEQAETALQRLVAAFTVSDDPPPLPPLVAGVI
ncbi:MAG: thymidine phosphorylase [Verrucomicrobia bacterium]|nr:thymidine phosphorylase [Verrucomicrobiota bacterium]